MESILVSLAPDSKPSPSIDNLPPTLVAQAPKSWQSTIFDGGKLGGILDNRENQEVRDAGEELVNRFAILTVDSSGTRRLEAIQTLLKGMTNASYRLIGGASNFVFVEVCLL